MMTPPLAFVTSVEKIPDQERVPSDCKAENPGIRKEGDKLRLDSWIQIRFLFFFCFICHIYPPFTRKRIVSLYFGREVRTRFGVAFFEVYGPPVFYIKVGRLVKCLAQGHNKQACRLVLHNLPEMPSAKQESCGCNFLKSFGMTRQDK